MPKPALAMAFFTLPHRPVGACRCSLKFAISPVKLLSFSVFSVPSGDATPLPRMSVFIRPLAATVPVSTTRLKQRFYTDRRGDLPRSTELWIAVAPDASFLAGCGKSPPWTSGLKTAHDVDRRKRRGFPGATGIVSSDVALYPQHARCPLKNHL